MRLCSWGTIIFFLIAAYGAFIPLEDCFAQNITLGAKGGLSIPNLTAWGDSNPISDGYKSRLGADGGVYALHDFSELFAVSLGVEYCAQGGVKEGFQAFPVPDQYKAFLPDQEYLWADFKSEAKFDYLLIPLLARVSWAPRSQPRFKVYVSAGPFAGFLLKARQITRGTSDIYLDEEKTVKLIDNQSFDETTDIGQDTHVFNLGILGFAG
ncbi:MAG: outer membrane beta-barrel protein, partial [Spirochaetota bacterium]